jgi:hypothetical protein
MVYFDEPGPKNTDDTLDVAVAACKERGIKHLVVASTVGATAEKATELVKGTDVRVIAVTHNTGFRDPGVQQFDLEIKAKVEEAGGAVYTGTMVTRGLGHAIRSSTGGSDELIVANTLRMFGEGMKVVVEIVAMASDAGLVPPEDVVAVAGTNRGADTAVVISAMPSNRFFEMRVREVLVKPRDFEPRETNVKFGY